MPEVDTMANKKLCTALGEPRETHSRNLESLEKLLVQHPGYKS